MTSNQVLVKTTSTDYINKVHVNDYATYNLKIHYYEKINPQTGVEISTDSGFFNSARSGYFRWTVIGINGSKITLKIELSVANFYSVTKQFTVIKGIIYNANNYSLGYNPFWISLDTVEQNQSKSINLAGTLNNPFKGKIINSHDEENFLGGYRHVLIFANVNNYVSPGTISLTGNIGTIWLYFSKFNGILVELQLFQDEFWIPLQFLYTFDGSFVLSKSNINFGSIDYVYTLLASIAPYWLPILIIFVITLAVSVIKIIKWIGKRNRHVRK